MFPLPEMRFEISMLAFEDDAVLPNDSLFIHALLLMHHFHALRCDEIFDALVAAMKNGLVPTRMDHPFEETYLANANRRTNSSTNY